VGVQVAFPPPAAVHPRSSGSGPDRVPGGGRILFTTAHGIGVLYPTGALAHLGGWRAADAFFDPLNPGDVLVHPFDGRWQDLRQYRRGARGWRAVRTWRAGMAEYSAVYPGGRWVAFNVFRNSKMTGTVRLTGRDGTSRVLHSDDLSVLSWTTTDQVLLSDWDHPRRVFVWDPFGGTLGPVFLDRNLASKLPEEARSPWLDTRNLSWSADGRYFTAPITWKEHGEYRTGVAVGTVSAGILRAIPTGNNFMIPTWSPTRPEVAYVVASRYGDPSARLFLFHVRTGRRTVVRRHVPTGSWWVAWSPAGSWMLLDDPKRNRWLFVSTHGATVHRPALGSFPRWATPGVGIHIVVC